MESRLALESRLVSGETDRHDRYTLGDPLEACRAERQRRGFAPAN